MTKISPILWTNNLDETIAFYEEALGFRVQRGTFPNFATAYRGEVEIMFIVPTDEPELYKDPCSKKEFFHQARLTGSLFILMEHVDSFWAEVKDKTTVKTAIANREYLMRDFSILDNNGYELAFGEDIS